MFLDSLKKFTSRTKSANSYVAMTSHKSICAEYHKLRQSLFHDNGDGNPLTASSCNLRISRNPFINLYRSYEVTHPNMSIMSVAAHVAKLWGKMSHQERQRFSFKSMVKLRDRCKDEQNSKTEPWLAYPPCDKTTSISKKTSDTKSAPTSVKEHISAEVQNSIVVPEPEKPLDEKVIRGNSETLCNVRLSTKCLHSTEQENVNSLAVIEPEKRIKVEKTFSFLELSDVDLKTLNQCRAKYKRKAKTKAEKRLRTDIRRSHVHEPKVKERPKHKTTTEVPNATKTRKYKHCEKYKDFAKGIMCDQRFTKSKKHDDHEICCGHCHGVDTSHRRIRNMRKMKSSLGGHTFSSILAKLDREIHALKMHRRTFDNLCDTCRNARIKEEKLKRAKRRQGKRDRKHLERA